MKLIRLLPLVILSVVSLGTPLGLRSSYADEPEPGMSPPSGGVYDSANGVCRVEVPSSCSTSQPQPEPSPSRNSCDDIYKECLKDAAKEDDWSSQAVESIQCLLEATACYAKPIGEIISNIVPPN